MNIQQDMWQAAVKTQDTPGPSGIEDHILPGDSFLGTIKNRTQGVLIAHHEIQIGMHVLGQLTTCVIF